MTYTITFVNQGVDSIKKAAMTTEKLSLQTDIRVYDKNGKLILPVSTDFIKSSNNVTITLDDNEHEYFGSLFRKCQTFVINTTMDLANLLTSKYQKHYEDGLVTAISHSWHFNKEYVMCFAIKVYSETLGDISPGGIHTVYYE